MLFEVFALVPFLAEIGELSNGPHETSALSIRRSPFVNCRRGVQSHLMKVMGEVSGIEAMANSFLTSIVVEQTDIEVVGDQNHDCRADRQHGDKEKGRIHRRIPGLPKSAPAVR